MDASNANKTQIGCEWDLLSGNIVSKVAQVHLHCLIAFLDTNQIRVVGAGIAKVVVFHQIAVGKFLGSGKVDLQCLINL